MNLKDQILDIIKESSDGLTADEINSKIPNAKAQKVVNELNSLLQHGKLNAIPGTVPHSTQSVIRYKISI